MTGRYFIIGIKHGFPCINVCQVPRERGVVGWCDGAGVMYLVIE